MSLSLDSIHNNARGIADYAIDATFRGLSAASQVISNGTSWAGRQVATYSPVIQHSVHTIASKIARLAYTVAAVAIQAFVAAKTTAQLGYQTAVLFVKTHPRDVKIALASGAAAVVIALVFKCFSEKETAKTVKANT